MEFLKNATEWVLNKEEEAAKNCRIDLKDLQKQIDFVKNKKEEMKKECEKNIAELEHILSRLEKIKSKEELCQQEQRR